MKLIIIGIPIKIENLEIAQHDFSDQMNWDDAKAACADLGDGWRLPTKDELNILYKNKVIIGGIANVGYWSSSEIQVHPIAWMQDFDSGNQSKEKKNEVYYVRAIRNKQVDINQIIGISIKINNLEIAQYDFSDQMNWDEVNQVFADLGDGWRLPTEDELNILYINKHKIGGFSNGAYWSSTNILFNMVIQDFDSGETSNTLIHYPAFRKLPGGPKYHVRAVRTL